MTFNGVSSTTLHLTHAVPLVPLLPMRERVIVKVAGRDGYVDFERDSYANRIIPVEMLVEASDETTLETYLADIADWLSGEGYIVFDKDATKRWYGKLYEPISPSRYPKAAKFVAYFECDPWPEDVSETTEDVDSEIDYGSEVEFYPQINVSLTADSSFVQVSLASTGEYVRVEGTFLNGDDFVFNMSTGQVTQNDSNIAVTLSSLFFGVPTGNQTITVTADSTYTADMNYHKRYRYA